MANRYSRRGSVDGDPVNNGSAGRGFDHRDVDAVRDGLGNGDMGAPVTDDSVRRYARNQAGYRYHEKVKRGSRKKKILAGVLISVLLLIGGAGAWALNYIHGINSSMLISESDGVYSALQPSSDSASSSDPFYMLLMGVDESSERDSSNEYDGVYRSDSIILARIDPGNQLVTLVSIHRDTLVDLSAYGGTGQDKINSAYAYGGRELMVKTISEFAGVPISHYAEINFDGFEAVVDALGGIEVDVEMSFYDPYLDYSLEGGYQTLNGEQALVYARARHAFDDLGDGDRYRAKHQRQVIAAIANKLLSSNAATMASTVSTLAQYIRTDMDVSEIVNIAKSFVGVDTSKCFYSAMEPTESEVIDGTYYEQVVQPDWREMMSRVDAGLDPGVDTAANETASGVTSSDVTTTGTASSGTSTAVGNPNCEVSVLNGSAIAGAAADTGEVLDASGYDVVTVGDASSDGYSETLVIYSDAGFASDAQNISSMIGNGRVLQSDEYIFDGDVLVLIGSDWR